MQLLVQVTEAVLGLLVHLGANLDEADISRVTHPAQLALVDIAGALPAEHVAAVGHVVLGRAGAGLLEAAVAVDPVEGHGGLPEALLLRVRPVQPPGLRVELDDRLPK